jgi:hypothetical protein
MVCVCVCLWGMRAGEGEGEGEREREPGSVHHIQGCMRQPMSYQHLETQ